VPRVIASTEVDFSSSSTGLHGSSISCARRRAPEQVKGGEFAMTFSHWTDYFRARLGAEEGQTMAEYGVVLAVICVLTVGIFTALSGGISNAVQNVIDVLPGNG
jgi:Flp pilus assembly pilin Flp